MPCNIASEELTTALRAIEPSRSYGEDLRPCTVILRGGRTVLRALASEDARGFHTDLWIHPGEVVKVRACQFRMPAHLATKLYAAGESGMGTQIFTMDLRSGQNLVFIITGSVIDFPDLPEGVTSDDVLDVHPHEGRERSQRDGYRGSAEFKELFFLPYDSASSSEG